MDARTMKRKLNQLSTLANELDAAAKENYGPNGHLFFEAEGTFHIMSGDSDDGVAARQEFIKLQSDIYCTMGAGVW